MSAIVSLLLFFPAKILYTMSQLEDDDVDKGTLLSESCVMNVPWMLRNFVNNTLFRSHTEMMNTLKMYLDNVRSIQTTMAAELWPVPRIDNCDMYEI